MTSLFTDSTNYTGPALDEVSIRRVEVQLGVRLPRAYVEVLQQRNGGVLRRRCFPTAFPTSWAEDHFELDALLGIGGKWGIDSDLGSRAMVQE